MLWATIWFIGHKFWKPAFVVAYHDQTLVLKNIDFNVLKSRVTLILSKTTIWFTGCKLCMPAAIRLMGRELWMPAFANQGLSWATILFTGRELLMSAFQIPKAALSGTVTCKPSVSPRTLTWCSPASGARWSCTTLPVTAPCSSCAAI